MILIKLSKLSIKIKNQTDGFKKLITNLIKGNFDFFNSRVFNKETPLNSSILSLINILNDEGVVKENIFKLKP